MCNAWNHSYGCTCGWGGEGHLGGSGYSWNAEATWGGGYDLNSPNAHCPVCGDAVFFIRPGHGGCGWFDEVGPPWPKHPCMDTPRRMDRFPSPLSVPALPNPQWTVPGWETVFAALTPHFDNENCVWVIQVHYDWLQVAQMPPTAISPVYFQSLDDTSIYGVIEYLAVVRERVATVRLHTVNRTRHLLGRSSYQSYPPSAKNDDWEMLRWFVREGLNLNARTAQSLLNAIKKECDWLLDPHWQWTNSGPTLVRSRVEQLCAGFSGADAEKVYRWMALLL